MIDATREPPSWPNLRRRLVVTGSIFPDACVGVSEKGLEQAYVQHLDGNAPLIHILKDGTRVRRLTLPVHVPVSDQPVPKAVGFPGRADSVQ